MKGLFEVINIDRLQRGNFFVDGLRDTMPLNQGNAFVLKVFDGIDFKPFSYRYCIGVFIKGLCKEGEFFAFIGFINAMNQVDVAVFEAFKELNQGACT